MSAMSVAVSWSFGDSLATRTAENGIGAPHWSQPLRQELVAERCCKSVLRARLREMVLGIILFHELEALLR